MSTYSILFVDDDRAGRQVALYNLEEAGYAVKEAASAEEALASLAKDEFDCIITDIRMPGLSGIDLLKRIRRTNGRPAVLVITAFGTVETAVEAMKKGADDFILKPFNRDQLLLAVSKAIKNLELISENRRLKIKAKGIERPIVFASPEMKKVIEVADQTAPSDAPVLITGASGTGKELVARRIHVMSSRAEGPFAAVNCAAIPSELLEAELFGYKKGAFTGASRDRLGRFRQAEGGSLFLDEIGDLPLELQAKLLRVVQEKAVSVIGKDSEERIDVRIISATNKDLLKLCKESRFREDLYYRLNVVNIYIPPLKERVSDIAVLTDHFVSLYGKGRNIEIPESIRELFRRYDWPGNVRELENICNRLVVLCRSREINAADLPHSFPGAELPVSGAQSFLDAVNFPPDGFSLADLERDVILKVLEQNNWNVSQAAGYLRVPRHVIAYRMEKYGISQKQD